MRPKDYWAVLKAYNKADNDRLIYTAELFRGLGIRIVNLFAKQRIKRAKDFWAMPWDEENEPEFKIEQIDSVTRSKQVQELLKRISNG